MIIEMNYDLQMIFKKPIVTNYLKVLRNLAHLF